MTRFLLILAGPTPWDADNRLTGQQSLPLTPDAVVTLKAIVASISPPPAMIYLHKANEACREAGALLATQFGCRIKDVAGLGEMKLGLWEGLTREEVRRRFPTVIPQWQQEPLSVLPPEGESLGTAIERVRPALDKILKRHRGGTVCLVLRPMMMQIVRGLLRNESPETIAGHLNNVDVMETIELEHDVPIAR
jgi:probable phosphoglycerate mutase